MGLVLVALGGLLLADRLSGGALRVGAVLADWWPTVLIAGGLLQLFHAPRAYFGALLVTGLGLLLLLENLGVVPDAGFGAWWAVLLILLGLRLLSRGFGRRSPRARFPEGALDAFVFFGERDVVAGRPFLGGRVGVLFGGATVDLRAADAPPEGAALEVTAAFGGAEVLVPVGWDVRFSGFPILGAAIDRTGAAPEGAPRLDIRATAVLGRIEVRPEAG